MIFLCMAVFVNGELNDGLVNYYSFDINDSDDIGDSYIKYNSMTFNDTNCISGNCYGQNNEGYMLFNSPLTLGSNDWSLSYWVYRAPIRRSVSRDIWIGSVSTNEQYIQGYVSDDSFHWTQWREPNNAGTVVHQQNSNFTGRWFFYTMTYDSANHSTHYYMNGTFVKAFLNYDWEDTWANNLTFGERTGVTDQYLIGNIDEIGAWNRTLNITEVIELYNNHEGLNPTILPISISITTLNASNINHDTTINFSVFDSDLYNCTIEVNGSIRQTRSNLIGTENYMDYLVGWGYEGLNEVVIECYDGGNLSSDSVYVFVDTIQPDFNYINMIQDSNGLNYEIDGSIIDEDLHFNVSIFDENLYSLNVSVCHNLNLTDCEYERYIENINDSGYVFDDTANLSLFGGYGLHYFRFIASDYHTDKDIKDKFKDKIIDIDKGKRFIHSEISVTNSDFKTFSHVVKDDRVTWQIELSKDTEKLYLVFKDDTNIIKKVSRAPFLSFVHGEQWTDFNTYDGTVTDYQRINDHEWHITITADEPTKYFNFYSTGIINSEEVNLTAYIVPYGNVTANSPDGDEYIVNATNLIINFSYHPYIILEPDNCSIILNDDIVNIDQSIDINIENVNNYNIPLIAGSTVFYEWNVSCQKVHNHTPYYEVEEYISETLNFTVISIAETTTSTSIYTSTTIDVDYINTELKSQGFATVGEGLFFIFVGGLWVVFMLMLFSVKGKHNATPQIINVLQLLFGLFLGFNLLRMSFIVGVGVMLISLVLLMGFRD